MPGSYVFAPRCGRAIFCATACVSSGMAYDTHAVAQFFARAIFCATASWSKRVSRAISAVTQMAMLFTMLKIKNPLVI